MTWRHLRNAVLLGAACSAAWGDVVVPNAQTSVAGNSPLRLGNTPVRLQQIIGSGQFPGPITILALRLRSAPGTGPVSQTGASIQVTLSTTQAYPNTANGHALPSPTYANNVGPDASIVYQGGGALSSPGCAAPGPCPFDMVIPFAAPFSYDPSRGRLLIDVQSSASTGTTTGSLDGVSFTDSNGSSAALVGFDPTLPTGTVNLAGIVFQLQTPAQGPVPTVSGVTNSADFSNRICPGALADIFGANFGSTMSAITVTVGGKPGYVTGVFNGNQIRVQLPVDVPAGSTTLTVAVANTVSAPFNLTLDTYAPGLISSSGTGTILTANGTRVTVAAPAKPGDTLSAFAVGLGPTSPATPAGPAAAANRTVTTPTLTIGGVNANVIFAGAAPGQVGLYQINFTVPAGVQGTVPVALSIGGKSSNTVALPLYGISAIVSNASFGSSGTAAPGTIVSLFANGLGSADQTSGFPGTVFQNVSVSFNGTAAPLFHLVATQGQIDLLVPLELPESGTVNVQVNTPAGSTPNFPLKMSPASPGMYFIADPDTKNRFNALAQFNGTAWLDLPASTAAALKIPACAANTNPASLCGKPANTGDILVLYGTGFGRATPKGDPNGATLRTGTVAPADGSTIYQTVSTPSITIADVPAPVLFSGLSPGFAGLYQINLQVPAGISGDDLPLVVTQAGATDRRTISVQLK